MKTTSDSSLQSWRADGLIDWDLTARCLNIFELHPQNTSERFIFSTVIFGLSSYALAITFMARDGLHSFILAALFAFAASGFIMVLMLSHTILHSYASKHLSCALWQWSEDFNPHDVMKDSVTRRHEPLLRLLECIKNDPNVKSDWSNSYELSLLVHTRQKNIWPSKNYRRYPDKFGYVVDFISKNLLYFYGGLYCSYAQHFHLNNTLNPEQKEKFFQAIAPASYARELSNQMRQLCSEDSCTTEPHQHTQRPRL